MSSEYEVVGCKFKTRDFTTEFKYAVADVKFWDGIYIVLLSIPNKVNEIDNIYGVNNRGEIVWRIESPLTAFNVSKDEQGYNYLASSIYVHMHLNSDGTITANTFSGMRYSFDYKTGRLIKKETSRW